MTCMTAGFATERNYQVFKDLFKITQMVTVMQSSYQNIILDDCNMFLYSRNMISKDVQIDRKYRSVAGQILNVCRANVESKLGKSGKNKLKNKKYVR